MGIFRRYTILGKHSETAANTACANLMDKSSVNNVVVSIRIKEGRLFEFSPGSPLATDVIGASALKVGYLPDVPEERALVCVPIKTGNSILDMLPPLKAL